MKRLIDTDPMTGVKTFHEYNHLTKTTTISTQSDVEANLNHNKTLYNDSSLKSAGIKNGMWMVASIPLPVIDKWLKEGLNVFDKNHKPALMRKLHDPEFRYLRTSSGRIT